MLATYNVVSLSPLVHRKSFEFSTNMVLNYRVGMSHCCSFLLSRLSSQSLLEMDTPPAIATATVVDADCLSSKNRFSRSDSTTSYYISLYIGLLTFTDLTEGFRNAILCVSKLSLDKSALIIITLCFLFSNSNSRKEFKS